MQFNDLALTIGWYTVRLIQHWREPKPRLRLTTRALKGGDQSVWYSPRKVMEPEVSGHSVTPGDGWKSSVYPMGTSGEACGEDQFIKILSASG
mgnify:CR=1 FL=1